LRRATDEKKEREKDEKIKEREKNERSCGLKGRVKRDERA
jgi:hypothetical protein